MKTTLHVLVFLVFIVFCNCKDKRETTPSDTEKKVSQPSQLERPSPLLLELLQFAETNLADSIDIDQILVFKKIDTAGRITTIDMKEGVRLYKEMTTLNGADTFPIFEIRNTDAALLPVSGKGFGGPIWGKVLVDKTTMAIEKIEFGHKAESDGYGAAMTQSSFEDKFAGAVIDLDKNTFTLQGNREKRIDDGVVIDGIAGATITSQAALEIVNEGLKKYKGYLVP